MGSQLSHAGAKRTCSLGDVVPPTCLARPRASITLPSAVVQLFSTCTVPSPCAKYCARVPATQLRWNRLGNLAISYQVPM